MRRIPQLAYIPAREIQSFIRRLFSAPFERDHNSGYKSQRATPRDAGRSPRRASSNNRSILRPDYTENVSRRPVRRPHPRSHCCNVTESPISTMSNRRHCFVERCAPRDRTKYMTLYSRSRVFFLKSTDIGPEKKNVYPRYRHVTARRFGATLGE